MDDDAYIRLGIPYDKLRDEFSLLAARFPLRGAGDMSISELVRITGLTETEALLAKQRLFSEPFLYAGDELAELEAAAAGRGLQIARGGRFYHLLAENQSKGNAVCGWLRQLGKNFVQPLVSAGLGDSPNDFSLLAVVDHPFLVKQKSGRVVDFPLETITRTREAGPAGWSEAVSQLLDDYFDACQSEKEKCHV